MMYILIRLSLHHQQQFQKLLLYQIDLLLVRSLDYSDYQNEREEAFNLIYKMLFFYRKSNIKQFLKSDDSSFTFFPKSVLKSILAIALDRLPRLLDVFNEDIKSDDLTIPCLGVIMELSVINPDLILKIAGTEWIVRSVVGPGANNPNISTMVNMILIKWIDTLELRKKSKLNLVVEQIFAPLIDLGFFYQKNIYYSKDDLQPIKISQILQSVSTVFLSFIKTWSGLFACSAIENNKLLSSSPFKLLEYLGFGTSFNPAMMQIRDMVINICCEFVDMPYASKKFNDWSDAINFYSKMHLPDKFKTGLRDDFVVGEIEALQTSGILTNDNVDCLMSFRALATYILINAGLPQALARLIMSNPDDPVSIKATLLFSDILRSGANFLPSERKLMLLSIPSLIQAASERTQLSRKLKDGILTESMTYSNSDNASILIHRLDQLNDIGFNRLSLEKQLINIELYVKGGESFNDKIELEKQRSSSFIEPDEKFEKLLLIEPEFFSKVTSKLLDLRHLESIVICLESDDYYIMKKYKHNDKLHSFFTRIFIIILPSNGRFISDSSSINGNIIKYLCKTVKLLVPLANSEPHYGELIDKFLLQFKEQLDTDQLYKGVFNLKNLLNNNSHYYFAILSAIGSTFQGYKLIENSGIYQMFMDLVLSTTSIEYVKLIISSLNYTYPGITRIILETALTSGDHQTRKWCTRFLGVLAGSNVLPDFNVYGMKLMINQLSDKNAKIVRHAVRLLHFWIPRYPDSLTMLSTIPFEPLGSAGILLKTHLFGSEKLVEKMINNTKELIEYWYNEYQKEYVQIIEEDMKLALLNVKRSINGTFARPTSERYDKFGVKMPIHLYGELSKHQLGRKLLLDFKIPTKLLKILINSNINNDDDILNVKSSLLSLGNIAGNLPNGLIECIMLPETIPIICRYAEECSTLSIRGTAILSLNLIGKTEDGSRILASLGWESNRHIHVVDQVCQNFSDKISSIKSNIKCQINCIDGDYIKRDKCFSISNFMDLNNDKYFNKNINNINNDNINNYNIKNNINSNSNINSNNSTKIIKKQRRRVYSDSFIELPYLHKKKVIKKDKLTLTKSMPMNSIEVRIDRTFTHESNVTSGFGSAQDDNKTHQIDLHKNSSTLNTSSFVGINDIDGYDFDTIKDKNNLTSTIKTKDVFAPTSLSEFIDPTILSLRHGKISNLLSNTNDFSTSIESTNSMNIASNILTVNRENYVNETECYPHFSTIYRKQHGISGFEQQTTLNIPNRAHSTVTYNFISHAEIKNIEKYEKLLSSVGEWVPYKPSKQGIALDGSLYGWTITCLPSRIELICKNIFDTKNDEILNDNDSSMKKQSYQRCFYCISKMSKGKSTNHFNSIDPKMRKDILKFISMFEFRGNSLQKKLNKMYGDRLQHAFADPCLYSDVLELLSDLNHGVKSRREIHRIFTQAAYIGFNSIYKRRDN